MMDDISLDTLYIITILQFFDQPTNLVGTLVFEMSFPWILEKVHA